MDCKMFKDGINEFKTRPILFNILLTDHLKENPDCSVRVSPESWLSGGQLTLEAFKATSDENK